MWMKLNIQIVSSLYITYKMVTSGSEYQGRDTEWLTPKSKII